MFILLMTVIITGCKTQEQFNVSGTPGTYVYSPDKTEIGKIGENGTLKVTVPSDAYYGFMYTYNETEDVWIPFGLDTKVNNHRTAKFMAAGGGAATAAVGGAALVVAGIFSGEVAAAVPISLIGALGAVAGGPTSAVVYGERMRQLSYQYNFSYLSQQQTNSDIELAPYVAPEMTKTKEADVSDSPRIKIQSKTTKKTKKSAAVKSKINIGNVAAKVAASYAGNGALMKGNRTEETLGNIEVVVTAISSSAVSVRFLCDGDSLFDEEFKVNVVKDKNGGYSLSSSDYPMLKLTVTATGVLSFIHEVETEDGIAYTFKGSARKKKTNR